MANHAIKSWWGTRPFTGDQEQMLEDVRQHGPLPIDIHRKHLTDSIMKSYKQMLEDNGFARMYMQQPFRSVQGTFPIPRRLTGSKKHSGALVNHTIQMRNAQPLAIDICRGTKISHIVVNGVDD